MSLLFKRGFELFTPNEAFLVSEWLGMCPTQVFLDRISQLRRVNRVRGRNECGIFSKPSGPVIYPETTTSGDLEVAVAALRQINNNRPNLCVYAASLGYPSTFTFLNAFDPKETGFLERAVIPVVLHVPRIDVRASELLPATVRSTLISAFGQEAKISKNDITNYVEAYDWCCFSRLPLPFKEFQRDCALLQIGPFGFSDVGPELWINSEYSCLALGGTSAYELVLAYDLVNNEQGFLVIDQIGQSRTSFGDNWVGALNCLAELWMRSTERG
jgi:hypothetical protein